MFTMNVEIIVRRLSLTAGAGQFLSSDTRVRDSSEQELCPSEADSFEFWVSNEFLLVSLVLEEEEEEEADERGLLPWAWLQESSLGGEDRVCSCLKSLWISPSERLVFSTSSPRAQRLASSLLQIKQRSSVSRSFVQARLVRSPGTCPDPAAVGRSWRG